MTAYAPPSVSELELWTVDQAAEHCGGLTASTYRSYVARQGAPAPDRFDPATGRKLVRADLVREWHANRKGRGHRSDLKEQRGNMSGELEKGWGA